VTVVVWDLGGVVARFRPERRLAALAAATGLDEQRIDDAIWGSGLDDTASCGELDPDATWAAVLAALDHRATRDAVRAAWATAFVPDPAVLALVDAVAAGAGIALLSNNGPVVDDCLDHELADIGLRFEHRLLSWRLGAMKPDRRAFERAAAAIGRPPHDLLLVDDEPANVAAAQAAGWHAVRAAASLAPASDRR